MIRCMRRFRRGDEEALDQLAQCGWLGYLIVASSATATVFKAGVGGMVAMIYSGVY